MQNSLLTLALFYILNTQTTLKYEILKKNFMCIIKFYMLFYIGLKLWTFNLSASDTLHPCKTTLDPVDLSSQKKCILLAQNSAPNFMLVAAHNFLVLCVMFM